VMGYPATDMKNFVKKLTWIIKHDINR
jgi:hypothetical protein